MGDGGEGYGAEKRLAIDSCHFSHPVHIIFTPYVAIGNHWHSNTLLYLCGGSDTPLNDPPGPHPPRPHPPCSEIDCTQPLEPYSFTSPPHQFDGLHVGWFRPLFSGSAVNSDPCTPSLLCSATQLHRLPDGEQNGGATLCMPGVARNCSCSNSSHSPLSDLVNRLNSCHTMFYQSISKWGYPF